MSGTDGTPKTILLISPDRLTVARWRSAVPDSYRVVFAESLLTGSQRYDEHQGHLKLIVVAETLAGDAPADSLITYIFKERYAQHLILESTAIGDSTVSHGYYHTVGPNGITAMIRDVLAKR
jgi:hypothetical protein